MILGKHEIEAALHAEKREITEGRLKEDNPLDVSEGFAVFCEACRRGDLRLCQEKITDGVNINARDRFDYTPLILASLCGHFEVVQLLLESGALCERDTFQGERCLYNALNDRIRDLLLSYDYSKSANPLQPLAGHITSLLSREHPKTSDITLITADEEFHLHKFILSARSPYFARKLAASPETTSWRLSSSIPTKSFEIVIRYLYLGEVSTDLGLETQVQEVLTGIDKLSRQLEIERLFEAVIERGDRRLARQRRTEEVERARNQLEQWFRCNVLKHKLGIDTSKAQSVRWDRDNGIFADVLLQANELLPEDAEDSGYHTPEKDRQTNSVGIPVGPTGKPTSPLPKRKSQQERSVLFPCHRAMLLRSEFFLTMFSSPFREAQKTPHLQIVPIDCTPQVLEIVLTYLYTERGDMPLDVATDVLFAADLLFIDRLKQRAATIISTLDNGSASVVKSENSRGEADVQDLIDIYDVIRAGWDTRVHRLEEFGAKYIAYRLERYIDDPEFEQLVKESAARIKARQETDTVELIDDIRYYLSERFKLRFEDTDLDELIEGGGNDREEIQQSQQSQQQMGGVAAAPIADATKEAAVTNAEDLARGTQDLSFRQNPAYAAAAGQPDESSPEVIAADSILLSGSGALIRTLDGEVAGHEFAQDAMNYQILLGKIDHLLASLHLDA